ncbi:hypothetical protein JV173_02660 [Acholeplasma equirhinis]|uniref:GH36-type glycosyl hydrolase domain-containing protein n=1 Tax=Acholeplasma equirhinis TaxID=555393 RepID=UPI00197A830F|nr:hypothetical protein [Acholeplasma equirhinis]MBN3490410.1 hypothetical protein [Acholeplasma equirhinis]
MEKIIKLDKNYGHYLPLFNLKGLKASITPYFGGDLKLDHHHFVLEPVSELSLFKHQLSRNVIFTVNGQRYFLNGDTEIQQNDEVYLTIGGLYQKVLRKNALFDLSTTSFIPVDDLVEVHKIEIKNNSLKVLEVDTITAIPLYGRSADNLRDHRHVTSLLNRTMHKSNGILMKPTLSFDERGHLENHYTYSVFADIKDIKVNRIISNLDDFINGGSLNFPRGLNLKDTKPANGYEVIGAIGFEKFILKPNESKVLTVVIGVSKEDDLEKVSEKYFDSKTFEDELKKVEAHFKSYTDKLNFEIENKETSELLEWVTLQPVLRRYFGNSYLPHHDYGRGGRGWRDLWQDLLSLIMFNDSSVNELLFNNFAGIRIDGSNATIIGDKPGEFVADRNKIVRVWSDHGAWPLLTTKMYIDETGNLEFLLKKQSYFDDQFTHYTHQIKENISEDHKLKLSNTTYHGTVLEHLLLQNMVAHLNTGKHGFVKLEDADWNDGLDMAHDLGETIAFTHFYANNLKVLADLITELDGPIEMFESLYLLINEKIDLHSFFNRVKHFNDRIILVDKNELIQKLEIHYFRRLRHIEQFAWIKQSHLQSYVNNFGDLVDNEETMNLTGQAMALLSETLDQEDAEAVADTTKKLLFRPEFGGYLLNTNYDKVMMELGRAYGFQYGHKENGAMFSHMAIMYIYGLYRYNLVSLGKEGFQTLINKALDKDAQVLAGIPEYFNDQAVGKYLYLTGSASWLLKLLRDEVFGIKLVLGKLMLEPKLTQTDFINGKASITTIIKGNKVKVTYHNEKHLDYGNYKIVKMISQGQVIENLSDLKDNLEVYLDEL